MDPLTPEQNKQLKEWAFKRDAILNKIGILSTQLEEKEKKNIELSETRTEIETAINKGLGRLAQIKEQEDERATLISKEVSDLEKEKVALENKIPGLKNEVGSLTSEKNILVEVIANLTKTHEAVLDRVGGLDKVVESVSRLSAENISEFKKFFEELKTTVKEIVSGNKKVMSETDIMIARVPKILREVTTPVRVIRPVLNKKRLVAKGDIPSK